MDAIDILESMDQVTPGNPSAFITKAVNDRLHGKVDIERRRWNQVTALCEELSLDERASKVVEELPAPEAYKMLQNCKDKLDTVRNPSAFVLKGVAVVQKELESR